MSKIGQPRNSARRRTAKLLPLPVGPAERRKRLAELDGQIYQLEQEEERTIELLEEQGHDIARRPDADPAAALGLPGKAAA